MGSKPGAGGPASHSDLERVRKERVRQLQIDTLDVANDPYILRNHLGSFECRLCLTLHSTENSYLAHTSGKKHQTNLYRRQLREQRDGAVLPQQKVRTQRRRVEKIGQPGYKVVKQKDPETDQKSLLFEIEYPHIAAKVKPKYRIMSSYEQRIEKPDHKYQYLLVAAEPYETIGFKIPNIEIDFSEGKYFEAWDREQQRYTLQLSFVDQVQKAAIGSLKK